MRSIKSKELSRSDKQALTGTHIEDLKAASKKMSGAKRRSFQAAMSLKDCQGNPRQTETVFGWNLIMLSWGFTKNAPVSLVWACRKPVAALNAGRINIRKRQPLYSNGRNHTLNKTRLFGQRCLSRV